MNERTVHFGEVTLHRVLGIPQGEGFGLEDMSEGVNLVHGPNGSGKTTFARAVQEALWPGRTDLKRPTMSGRFHVGDDEWRIDIDAGHVSAFCNGAPSPPLELGPPERRRAYWLALDELFRDDNEDFAKKVADASQGGYDLDFAAANLEFLKKRRTHLKERKELQIRMEEVKAARRRQQEVEKASRELVKLKEERERSVKAQQDVALLENAIAYQEAAARSAEARIALAAFPEGVGKLRGDEREKLDELAEQKTHFEKQLSDEQRRVEDAQDSLRKANLPEEGVSAEVFADLGGWQRRLAGLETKVEGEHQKLAEARAAGDTSLQRLGDTLTEEQLDRLEAVEIEDVSRFSRQADRVRAQDEGLTVSGSCSPPLSASFYLFVVVASGFNHH